MKGLTLIETVVYIALLSILMTGAIMTTFDLLEGASRTNTNATVQEEGNFVMRKLDWALDDALSVASSGSSCAKTLTVTKKGYGSGYAIVFSKSGTALKLSENGGTNTSITTSNVSVSCFKVDTSPSLCGSLGGVIATTTITGLDFVVTKCKH